MTNLELYEHARQRAQEWLGEGYDLETQTTVKRLLEQPPASITEAFHTDLAFGTGGLRGVMGVGTNRMNRYTVSRATQGFANYLISHYGNGEHAVAIAYDCRHNSREFAEITADVFAANGFRVYLCNELRPTPFLSFLIRKYQCVGGVVITASHNPPQYNGYKVYWSDGAQITHPHDANIISEVKKITRIDQVSRNGDAANIRPVGREDDVAYLDQVLAHRLAPDEVARASAMPIVYTSLHGTGETLVPEALNRMGFRAVESVKSQAIPDGNFSTVASPNPEEGEALEMAIERAAQLNAEVVLGTDPDCDRVGIAVRTNDGYRLLNGNDTGALLIDYQLNRMSELGTLPKNGYVARTIVTSKLFADIANDFGLPCYVTLTGFKHIARLIADREPEEKFITGGEESYGYMIGDFVRDKDGVAASCMVCEMVAWAYNRGLTVNELLQTVHERYGLYREALVSMKREGISGAQEIAAMMEGFRSHPPLQIAGLQVVALVDYQRGQRRELTTGKTEAIDLPRSNVLQFELEGGSVVTARPSGTEPKIKFYYSVCNREEGDYFARWADAEALIERLKSEFPPSDTLSEG